jgi:hypothetical protein
MACPSLRDIGPLSCCNYLLFIAKHFVSQTADADSCRVAFIDRAAPGPASDDMPLRLQTHEAS